MRPQTDAAAYVAQQKTSDSAHAALWGDIESLLSRRLIHQLTAKLQELVALESFRTNGEAMLGLYNEVIREIDQKINPFCLVEMAVAVEHTMTGYDQAVKFIEEVKDRVQEPLAKERCRIAVAERKVLHDDVPGARKLLEEIETYLDSLPSVPAPINAEFYRVFADLKAKEHDSAGYYKMSLKYLGCIKPEDLELTERQTRAFHIATAAILATDVHSFGELLLHPILDSLKDTQYAWMIQLLEAFNAGDMEKYEQLRPEWSKSADLRAQEPEMNHKLRMQALINMVSGRPATERTIPLVEVSKACRVHEDDVEMFLLRALSLELITGTIDEVDGVIHCTHVLPRVPDRRQIGELLPPLKSWSDKIDSMINEFQAENTQFFAAETF
eukprot:Clim_evm21s2 gene=Clim_evmTU21s2